MEQNFQKQTAGPDSHIVWSGPGAADKTSCVAVFFEEHAAAAVDEAAVLHCAQTKNAVIHAYYIRPVDVARYGAIDHLAPAGDMENFQRYVAAQDLERAREFFAPVLRPDLPWRLQVLYGGKAIPPCLECLKREKKHLEVFIYRTRDIGDSAP